jgi:hypothetical protein
MAKTNYTFEKRKKSKRRSASGRLPHRAGSLRMTSLQHPPKSLQLTESANSHLHQTWASSIGNTDKMVHPQPIQVIWIFGEI